MGIFLGEGSVIRVYFFATTAEINDPVLSAVVFDVVTREMLNSVGRIYLIYGRIFYYLYDTNVVCKYDDCQQIIAITANIG